MCSAKLPSKYIARIQLGKAAAEITPALVANGSNPPAYHFGLVGLGVARAVFLVVQFYFVYLSLRKCICDGLDALAREIIALQLDGSQAAAREITQRPHAPSGVAAFMSAHSKTPYITPSMEFSSGKGVVRGRRGRRAAAGIYLELPLVSTSAANAKQKLSVSSSPIPINQTPKTNNGNYN